MNSKKGHGRFNTFYGRFMTVRPFFGENRFMEPPPTQIIAFLPLNVFNASNAPFPWYKSLGNVNLAM